MPTLRNSLSEILVRCRSGFIAVGAFSMVINLLTLTVSIYMLQVYDRVLTGRSVETLIYLTVITSGALVAIGLLEFLRSRLLVRLGTWIDRAMSPNVFERGLENAVRGVRYRTEALRDVAALRNYLGGAGIMALFDAPWTSIYLVFIFLLHSLLGFLALGGALLLFSLALLNDALTAATLKRANSASTRGYQFAEAAFRNAEAIDGMGMGAALARRWDSVNAHALQLQAKASDRVGLITAVTKPFRLFLQVAVLGLGAWLVLQQELSPGGMVAASIIMSRALTPAEQAIVTWKQTISAREAWTRLSALFQTAPIHHSTMALPRPRGRLTIEGVTYIPAGARHPVLRAISFAIPPGEALAIIGPSAAGKSTLARLIVGLAQPQHGFVRLDGADVFAWSRDNFGHHVGYLPQDVELFPGTVGENIARMEEGEPSEVVFAAKMAGVHELILRLPNAYETEIGEQGANLSGGQRQRIALARALYRRPALLVLDEPNSSLDASGEAALNSAVAAMKLGGCTVVVVAHRPSLMTHIDRILVLHEGKMQLAGPRDAVLAELHHLQRPANRPFVRAVGA
ncbi:MAG: type I secretion system permease/ATPase [Methyloceanibacter sp.]